MLLGAIADDFTGATDLCSMLVRGGMRTVQVIGTPALGDEVPDADAVVVAIKSRTAPVKWAVEQSLAGLAWLRAAGARQYFFKYCSTFDSTDQGNIGPVTDALARELGCGFSLHCPAFPTNGRTVYLGHLFVGGVLLNESGMQHHPLTPMTDPNLVRVLSRQTDGMVGLVAFPTLEKGAGAIRDALTRLKEEGRRHAIVDAVTDAHLLAIGEAAARHALVSGGSGVAMGLPGNFRCAAGRFWGVGGVVRFLFSRDAGATRVRAFAHAGFRIGSVGDTGRGPAGRGGAGMGGGQGWRYADGDRGVGAP
jgi:uncharacterized protein YgbK (DUF1537 family)